MSASTPAPHRQRITAVERKDTPPSHEDRVHLRLPPLPRNTRPFTVLNKSFSWRPCRLRALRELSPTDDVRLVAFWCDHNGDRTSVAAELAFESSAVRELKANRRGASIRDAAQALHLRLVHLLQAYAGVLQPAQHTGGAHFDRTEFECFASVFTVLRGRQVVFCNVSWDNQRRVWQSLRAESSASVGISSGALTIAKVSSLGSSPSGEALRATSNTASHKTEATVQQDDKVVLNLPARPAGLASEPLVMRKIVFDWKPEECGLSHLRDFSAIDNAALATYWKTHREECADKPELFFERSAVDALSARLKFHPLREASYELHHNLVSLLHTYSSVLRRAREQGEVVLEPKVFSDFCSVYTALCGRDVEFKKGAWNKKKKAWEERELDSETSLNESASAGTLARASTASATAILPPRKRLCSSNGSHCSSKQAVSAKDGDGVEAETKVDEVHRNKRRRLTTNGAKERSTKVPSDRDDNAGASDCSDQESITKLEREVRRRELMEQLAKMKRENASHIREEERLTSKAKHEARVGLLRELRESALALHSAGMLAQAETVMERFVALLDEKEQSGFGTQM